MHTLVISDLHIGAGRGRAALEDPELVGELAEAIAQAQRLVLLGDIIELRQGPHPGRARRCFARPAAAGRAAWARVAR